MLFRYRPDGQRVKVPGYTKIVPLVIRSRVEATIFFDQVINLDKTQPFITRWNEENPDAPIPLTLMQVVLCSIARSIAQRPRMNRFVSNFRHYQRNNISVSFVAKQKLTDDGKEMDVIIPFRPEDTLATVNERFARHVGQVRSTEGNKVNQDVDFFGPMPIFILRAIIGLIRFMDRWNLITRGMVRLFPLYTTIYMTNVGSLKMQAPYHHNFELGTTGIFMALGKAGNLTRTAPDGTVTEHREAQIRWTFDDRIVDGIYSGRAMNLFKDYIENPEKMLEPASIDPKYLKELNLSEKGWKLWALD